MFYLKPNKCEICGSLEKEVFYHMDIAGHFFKEDTSVCCCNDCWNKIAVAYINRRKEEKNGRTQHGKT